MSYRTISLKDIADAIPNTAQDSLEHLLIECIRGFHCKLSPYHEDFLRNCIDKYEQHNTSRTYIIIDDEEIVGKSYSTVNRSRVIAGYFTVGLSSINLSTSKTEKLSKKKRKEIQKHLFLRDESLGCYVIGELCRAENRSKEELPGDYILNECLSIIKNSQEWVGGRLVLVDSRRKVLEALYQPQGFKELMPTGKKTSDGDDLITSYAVLN